MLAFVLVAAAVSVPPPALAQTQTPRSTVLAPPREIEDVAGWLEYKVRSHARAMPDEARLLFRRGLIARRAGLTEKAVQLVRGAGDLDPSFMAPRWALVRWLLFREPGRALLQLSGVVELARQDFAAQWSLWANGIYLAIQSWLVALLVLGLLILAFRQRELRHACKERIAVWTTPASAAFWAWVVLVAPFALGFGLALPTAAFLAMLWPRLKARERTVFVLLVLSLAALPLASPEICRLAAPMRDGETRVGSLVALESEPYTDSRWESFGRLARSGPDDPCLQFGFGWMAQQAGDPAAAEQAYRGALAHWPNDARVLNNLGNILALENRFDEAIRTYRQAIQADPADATAYFNLSQAYTHQYDFDPAGEALAKASALDFELVRGYKEQSGGDGTLTLATQWLAPGTLWKAYRDEPATAERSSLPPAWRNRIEFAGWPFTGALLLVVGLGCAAGRSMHRRLPLLRCSNCDAVVCRRCSERRRWEALCSSCARVAAGAPSPDFAKILLSREGRRRRHVADTLVHGCAMLIPGAGLVAQRRVLRSLLLLLLLALVAGATVAGPLPYAARTRIGVEGVNALPLLLAVLIPIHALSILGYLGARARQRAEDSATHRTSRPRRAAARLREPEAPAGREVA